MAGYANILFPQSWQRSESFMRARLDGPLKLITSNHLFLRRSSGSSRRRELDSRAQASGQQTAKASPALVRERVKALTFMRTGS